MAFREAHLPPPSSSLSRPALTNAGVLLPCIYQSPAAFTPHAFFFRSFKSHEVRWVRLFDLLPPSEAAAKESALWTKSDAAKESEGHQQPASEKEARRSADAFATVSPHPAPAQHRPSTGSRVSVWKALGEVGLRFTGASRRRSGRKRINWSPVCFVFCFLEHDRDSLFF